MKLAGMFAIHVNVNMRFSKSANSQIIALVMCLQLAQPASKSSNPIAICHIEEKKEMSDSGPTKSQLDFITRLRNASTEREELVQAYLRENDAAGVENLSVRLASTLIEQLKKIKVEGEKSSSFITGKQLSFLQSLIRDPNRNTDCENYLSTIGKSALNLLTMEEASSLIERLKSVKREDGELTGDRPVTEKQLKYIRNLQGSGEGQETSRKYIESLKKKSLEELTSKEASGLIDRLRKP